jgi:hypothetical protein
MGRRWAARLSWAEASGDDGPEAKRERERDEEKGIILLFLKTGQTYEFKH